MEKNQIKEKSNFLNTVSYFMGVQDEYLVLLMDFNVFFRGYPFNLFILSNFC